MFKKLKIDSLNLSDLQMVQSVSMNEITLNHTAPTNQP